MSSRPFKTSNRYALSRRFVDEVITMRSYGARIVDLASEMAHEAGESVHHPLSRDQIQRAVEANSAETDLVRDILLSQLETLQQAGRLPEQASIPVG